MLYVSFNCVWNYNKTVTLGGQVLINNMTLFFAKRDLEQFFLPKRDLDNIEHT